MPNPFFKFKQFTIYHDRCAMKVGTDGVLLGAWANVHNTKKVLDIGVGSGLVSLMLAQRNNNILIDAIDIDTEATKQAQENIANSPFSQQINCKNISFQEFDKECKTEYDLIVSNPPFFVDSLKSPDNKRTLARHTDSLYIDQLITISCRHLNTHGRIAIIFPHIQKELLLELAEQNKLYISAITNIFPTPTASPKRLLIEFSRKETSLVENNLIIEKERHVYTPEFTTLAKEFYLNM